MPSVAMKKAGATGKSRLRSVGQSGQSNTRLKASQGDQASESRQGEDAKAVKFLQSVARTLSDRASTYPPYSQESQRIADTWTTLHPAKHLTASHIAELMLIMKLVRYSAGNSPDSLTDLVGYAARIKGMQE